MTTPAKFVGRSVPRLEDRPLLTGQGRFAADINFPGQWHMRVVRSPVAHGKLKSIDASAALALPGVHAVWTYADVAHIPPIGFRLTGLTALEPYRQYALASDHVRYIGEPVAAVFADDQYLAEDAADLVGLAIEPLPVILDAAAAPGPFDADRVNRSNGDREEIRRCRCRVSRRRPNRRARSVDRAAFRRAAGNARRHRALRRGQATSWKCTAPPRCRIGTGIAWR